VLPPTHDFLVSVDYKFDILTATNMAQSKIWRPSSKTGWMSSDSENLNSILIDLRQIRQIAADWRTSWLSLARLITTWTNIDHCLMFSRADVDQEAHGAKNKHIDKIWKCRGEDVIAVAPRKPTSSDASEMRVYVALTELIWPKRQRRGFSSNSLFILEFHWKYQTWCKLKQEFEANLMETVYVCRELRFRLWL